MSNIIKLISISILMVTTFILFCCEDPIGPGNCPNHVDVMAQIGEQPIFSWSPSCEADVIIVYYHSVSNSGLDVLNPVWSLDGNEKGISPPITYGISPNGVDETISAIPLIEGEKYTIKVIRNIDGISSYDYIGELDFLYILQ